MGASASVNFEDDEILSKEKVIELSGDYFNEEEYKSISEEQGIRGQVWNIKVKEFLIQFNQLPFISIAGGPNTSSSSVNMNQNRERRPGLNERILENEEWCFLVGSLSNPNCLKKLNIKPFSSVPALLHGYHIAFFESDAVLYPSRSASCHGVLYKIDKNELDKMDNKIMISKRINEITSENMGRKENNNNIQLKRIKANVFQYNGIEVECWIHVLDNLDDQLVINGHKIQYLTYSDDKHDDNKEDNIQGNIRDSSDDFGVDDDDRSRCSPDVHEFDFNEISSTSHSLLKTGNKMAMVNGLYDEIVLGGISANTDISSYKAISVYKENNDDLFSNNSSTPLKEEMKEEVKDDLDIIQAGQGMHNNAQWLPEQRLMECLIQGYVQHGLNFAYIEWMRNHIDTKPRLTHKQLDYFNIPEKQSSIEKQSIHDDSEGELPVMDGMKIISENNKVDNNSFITSCNGKVLLFTQPHDEKDKLTLSIELVKQMKHLFGGKHAELILCKDQYDPKYDYNQDELGIDSDEVVLSMSGEYRDVLEDMLKRSPIGPYLSVIGRRIDLPPDID